MPDGPTIEQPDPDGQETIDGIIKGMTGRSETVEKREHHGVRASHAKSSACVAGSLAAHRLLGSLMRARLQVYQAPSDFRHRENGIVPSNTARF